MSGPPEIWLDPRVIRSINTEPDPEIPLVRYRSDERLAELLAAPTWGDEFFIQITLDDRTLIGLTNYGRIFRHQPDALAWFEIPGPEIEP